MALKFYWRCEGTTLDGTHDYTPGDNTAAATGSATIAAGSARVGSNGIDIVNNTDYFAFTVASHDLIAPSAGAIGFWVRVHSGAGQVFYAPGTLGQDFIGIAHTSGATREFTFRMRSSAGSDETLSTTTVSAATNTWYFIVARWNVAANDRRLEVYDNSLALIQAVENLTTVFDAAADLIGLQIGESFGDNIECDLDNIFIADSYGEDLPANATITSYTEYGGGGGSGLSVPRNIQALAAVSRAANL